MLRLFEAGGARDIELVGTSLSEEQWQRLRGTAARLLRSRKQDLAADLLESSPFELQDGTNGFGDEFSVLYFNAPFEKYIELTEQYKVPEYMHAYATIARTVAEIGPYIRFIAVSLNQDSTTGVVPRPELQITSDTVERALSDAERLIASTGAVSGVDRVHTAFHGYLKAVCEKNSVPVDKDASLAKMLKAIRETQPPLVAPGPRAGDIERILNCMATIADAFNPIRNMASVAHPNAELLEEPEAMLVINTIRTLLHYLDKKLVANN